MRRIAALVTNNLLCELVEQQRCAPRGKQHVAGVPERKPHLPVPFVVVLTQQGSLESNPKQENTTAQNTAAQNTAAQNSAAQNSAAQNPITQHSAELSAE
jgi:hypothetical protein